MQRVAHVNRLYRDLLKLRRASPFARQRADLLRQPRAFVGVFALRFVTASDKDRLLLFNLGCNLRLRAAPEQLLAPPAGREWEVVWSSESPEHGGGETPPLEENGCGSCAVVLRAK